MSEIDDLREDVAALAQQMEELRDLVTTVSEQQGLGSGPAEALQAVIAKFELMRDKLARYEAEQGDAN